MPFVLKQMLCDLEKLWVLWVFVGAEKASHALRFMVFTLLGLGWLKKWFGHIVCTD